jgi:hypothetical protein
MKRFVAVLTVTLTILALPGCVNDKPAPRLDSPDRTERIEAVRQARNRYGTRAPAAPTVSEPAKTPAPVITPPTLLSNGIDPALVGLWKGSWVRCEDYQFAADGTYTCDTLLYTFKGTWIVQPPDTLACRYSVFGSYFNQHFKYRIKGDTLELYDGFTWFAYTKAR